jgi:hypothetical protein
MNQKKTEQPQTTAIMLQTIIEDRSGISSGGIDHPALPKKR